MVPTITKTEIDTSFEINEATLAFTRKSDLNVTPAMKELKDGRTTIQLRNPNAHTLTISHGAIVANVKALKQITSDRCQWNNSQLSLHSQRKPTTSSTNSSRLQFHQPTNDGTRRLRRTSALRSSSPLNDGCTMTFRDSVNSKKWIQHWMRNS